MNNNTQEEHVCNDKTQNEHICKISIFTNIIGGKWKLAILWNLRNRTLRFGQLASVIDGISRKVLSDQLQQMDKDGLVIRKSFNETPPRVDYSLTKIAKNLDPLFVKLEEWVDINYINNN
jgi:DNA-binding HxlR family transcriptional regulator